MLKKILLYFLTFGLLFFLGISTHSTILESQNINLNFSLFNVYLFHAVFSFFVCTILSIIALRDRWFDQLGFVYLAVLVIKIGAFYGVFYKSIFSLENLDKTDSVSLMIPVGVFLITEVFFIAKILNTK